MDVSFWAITKWSFNSVFSTNVTFNSGFNTFGTFVVTIITDSEGFEVSGDTWATRSGQISVFINTYSTVFWFTYTFSTSGMTWLTEVSVIIEFCWAVTEWCFDSDSSTSQTVFVGGTGQTFVSTWSTNSIFLFFIIPISINTSTIF
jgi:hypothetical protein